MKVIDIIDLTAKLLNEIDLKDCIKYCKTNEITLTNFINETELVNNQKPSCLTDLAKKELKLILDCINIVQTRVSTEYFENYYEEEIAVENNEYDIDNLSQKLFKITAITRNNIMQFYKMVGDKLTLDSGNYLIKYAFIPADKGFDETVENHSGKMTILSFCYGVCSEYCLIKGLYDEAEMWQKRFDSSLKHNFRKINGIYLKSRRWF